jgi:hypothetical protein
MKLSRQKVGKRPFDFNQALRYLKKEILTDLFGRTDGVICIANFSLPTCPGYLESQIFPTAD